MPHDASKYPADWPAISARIRERDGHRCARCGVGDRVVGYWDAIAGAFVVIAPDGDAATRRAAEELHGRKVITVVLTVAHIANKDPMACSDDNLLTMCARCHLALDRNDHLRNASRTRAVKKSAGILPLFGDEIGERC